jgi:glycosyltransferase involved in cell wall biosynthesis
VIPKSLKKLKTPSIMTVHDTVDWLFPHYFQRGTFKILQILKKLKRADYILCPSEFARSEVIEHYKFEPSRVFATPLAACPELFKPTTDDFIYEKYNIPREPYLLSIASLEDRKNIHLLMEAFKDVIEGEKINDFNFVIVGAVPIDHYEVSRVFAKFRADPNLIKRFIYLDYVENEDLAALYSNARAKGYISHYEGFGLPIIEAMQCGCPVISSNMASLPEVCGNAGIQVDPFNKNDLCQAILDIYSSNPLCAEQSRLGLERAQNFKWHKTVEKTLEVYKLALKEA